MTYSIEFVGCHPDNHEKGGAVDPKTGIKHIPIAIVNHIAEGSLNGTISWFNNPKAQASTNYMVGKNGRIVQFVKEGVDRPFANGKIEKPTWNGFIKRSDGSIVNPNRYTISIEHDGKTSEPFTEEMYQATLWLHKKLITDWNIPITRDTIIGHNRIDGVDRPNCPGSAFPWNRLFADLSKWKTEQIQITASYPKDTYATVTANKLNIRRLPGEEYDIAGVLIKGDRVKVLGVINNWTKVDIGSNGIAWLWSEYISSDKQPIPLTTIPDKKPEIKDPIMGKSVANLDQMVGFIQKVNPNFDSKIAKAFLYVGDKYNVRGDVALCQSLIETGWFKFDGGTAVTPDQHNYCGMGVTQKGMKGASFSSIEEGVTAQIQHLFAYATSLSLPTGEAKVDPRFHLVQRGIAPSWHDLSNKWAMNANYGSHILSIYADMLKFIPEVKPIPTPQPDSSSKPDLTWQQKLGVDAVAYLASIGKISNPQDWPVEKMNDPAPTWLVMTLIARAQGMK